MQRYHSDNLPFHRATHSMVEDGQQKKLFFPIKGLNFEDMYDWSLDENKNGVNMLQGKHCIKSSPSPYGTLVNVNGEEVALFRLRETVYAVNETCPHAGGPLHMGDIEELPDRSVCVRCPWHNWQFDLESGLVKQPTGRANKAVQVYPCKVDDNGTVFVGFDHFANNCFKVNDCDF